MSVRLTHPLLVTSFVGSALNFVPGFPMEKSSEPSHVDHFSVMVLKSVLQTVFFRRPRQHL